MGTEPGSSSRATSGLNTWIISLLYFLILKFKNYVPWKKLTQIESTYMLYLLNLFFFLCCALEVNMRHSSMSRPLLRRPFQISATLCKRQRKGRMWDAGSRAREWRDGGEGGLKYIPVYLKPRQRLEWNVCKWWDDEREYPHMEVVHDGQRISWAHWRTLVQNLRTWSKVCVGVVTFSFFLTVIWV